jgi:murein DD-endopeptidase MepM/ murein hydrolase activator NlpD
MNRPSDPLQNLADALGEDVVAASPETLAAEVSRERGDGAGFALDFDRIVMRAERQARWRRAGQRLRALVPSATLRSWRPAMAAAAGVAVIVVAGDLYLHVGADAPRATLAPAEQSGAREPARDEALTSQRLAYRGEDGSYVPASAPAASPGPQPSAPPVALSADAPKRVRTVPIRPDAEALSPPRAPAPSAAPVDPPRRVRTVRIQPATEAPSPAPPPPAQTAPADARSLALTDRQRADTAAVETRQVSRLQSEPHAASTPAPAIAAVDQATTDRGAAPSFAWPLHGHVIADVAAAKTDQRDDGIDIAVPAGTDVRASADGVVAYTGDDLRNFGNLILVRHDGGFVTAYAHVDQILVKVNDQVHRGQVIAKSGSTGVVSTPLLHFEIRKGSAPVDARQYLPPDRADALK